MAPRCNVGAIAFQFGEVNYFGHVGLRPSLLFPVALGERILHEG
jgi:hypothetical protein